MPFYHEHVVAAFTHYLYAVLALFLLEAAAEQALGWATPFSSPVLAGAVSAAAALALQARAKWGRKKPARERTGSAAWLRTALENGLFTRAWRPAEAVVLVASFALQAVFLALAVPALAPLPWAPAPVFLAGAVFAGLQAEFFERLEDCGVLDPTR